MASKDALRRQRRRELDARRSKSRVRLGPCLPRWGKLKDSLGFSLHSELAQYLLDSYFSKAHQICLCSQKESAITASVETLHRLVVQVHTHSQRCPHPPSLQQGLGTTRATPCQGQRQSAGTESEQLGSCGLENGAVSTPVGLTEPGEALFGEISLSFVCEDGHVLSWCPKLPGKERMEGEVGGTDRGVGPPRDPPQGEAIKAGREGADGNSGMRTRSRRGAPQTMSPRHPARGAEEGTAEQSYSSHTSQEGHAEEGSTTVEPHTGSDDMETESPEAPQHRTAATTSPTEINTDPRGRTGKAHPSTHTTRRGSRSDRTSLLKDEVPHTGNKRKRKTNPKEMFLCTYEGCEKIFSSRQYLNHHMKYQHVQQKTFSCSHPSCGKSFNFKKHLKEHEKLHSNQRDYICEFCARAFRTNSNLLTHRRIHTGEKPLQCEVCGFTCSQKASLNWHMRKHNAESGYRFPCDICGRRFEKRDNVTAHRSKSHPDHSVSVPSVPPAPPGPPTPASPLPPTHTSPSPPDLASPSPPVLPSPSPPDLASPLPPAEPAHECP